MAMTLTSKQHPYKAGFGPFAPEIYRVAFPYEYRSLTGDAAAEALADLRRALTTRVAPESVAAVIIEPQQGEGGFVPAPPAYLRGLREICDEHGILLIADEVQTAFGRTGTLFAIEQAGVEPDLITVAKSIAGGLPLSGVLGRAEVMDAPGDSTIGGTYVGNPVACQAALAVLDEIDRLDLCGRARVIGEATRARLGSLAARVPQIGDVRGLGSMIGIEFVRDPRTREPAPEITNRVVEAALEHGLILLKAGLYGNVIRNLVPLVISDDQLAEALDVLEEAIHEAVEMAPVGHALGAEESTT
jgi:4-aminobutyrate aminotransferase/(S)-3-amino-2-methylpropionate transaminase